MRQDKLTKEDVGKCMYIENFGSDPFFTIGYVHQEFHQDSESDSSEFRGKYTHYISQERKFGKNAIWCYRSPDRGYTEATPEQKYWLDVCIAANKYIPEKEALKNYNLISEPQIFN